MMLASILLVSLSNISAQRYSSGIVFYDIEFDSEELDAASAAMLEGSNLILMFKDQKVRVEMDMQEMTTIAINDEDHQTRIVLVDMFGQKMYQTLDWEELEDSPSEEEFTVEYSGEIQDIAGMKTEQAIITYRDGQTAEFWICKDIVPGASSTDFTLSGIQGLPLEMDIKQNNMEMHLTAIEVILEEVDDELFDTTPPPGYTEVNNN